MIKRVNKEFDETYYEDTLDNGLKVVIFHKPLFKTSSCVFTTRYGSLDLDQIDENGNKTTGIGEFIRKYSLDEFPQFYNVLKGDMSLVGTRPPTQEEVKLYESRHRLRLAIKPGITGMWQVNGRSNVLDFEEVVKLDASYINEWSIWLDLKILVKTVLVVFKKEGSM